MSTITLVVPSPISMSWAVPFWPEPFCAVRVAIAFCAANAMLAIREKRATEAINSSTTLFITFLLYVYGNLLGNTNVAVNEDNHIRKQAAIQDIRSIPH